MSRNGPFDEIKFIMENFKNNNKEKNATGLTLR